MKKSFIKLSIMTMLSVSCASISYADNTANVYNCPTLATLNGLLQQYGYIPPSFQDQGLTWNTIALGGGTAKGDAITFKAVMIDTITLPGKMNGGTCLYNDTNVSTPKSVSLFIATGDANFNSKKYVGVDGNWNTSQNKAVCDLSATNPSGKCTFTQDTSY